MSHTYSGVRAIVSGSIVTITGSVDNSASVSIVCNLSLFTNYTSQQLQDFIAAALLSKALNTGVVVDANLATASQLLSQIPNSFISDAIPPSPSQPQILNTFQVVPSGIVIDIPVASVTQQSQVKTS